MPIKARISLSNLIPVGRNSGRINENKNKMLISGTPRIASMNMVQIPLIIGSEDLLPKANITPIGKDKVIPPIAKRRVTINPPQRLRGTISNIPRKGVPYRSIPVNKNDTNQAIKTTRGVILRRSPTKYPMAIIPMLAIKAALVAIDNVGMGYGQRANTSRNPA
jgi:hypothetical protein